jgi:putative PIN family toxin of toxin-antitoxin system
MRLVIDTNVFVSILIRPGAGLSALVDHIDQTATVLYSTETLTELVDVLRRQKFAKYTTSDGVARFVQWIVALGEFVPSVEPMTGSRDPKDDKFLSLALAGRADYLLSGDKDLLVLGRIGPIPIVTAADFLTAIKR